MNDSEPGQQQFEWPGKPAWQAPHPASYFQQKYDILYQRYKRNLETQLEQSRTDGSPLTHSTNSLLNRISNKTNIKIQIYPPITDGEI